MNNAWNPIASLVRSRVKPTAVHYALLLLLALLAGLTMITAVGHRTACPYVGEAAVERPF